MATIIKRSPTRVDFAGGTLDCWPLYLMVGGAKTINLAIDILTTAQLELRGDKKISLSIRDLNYKKEFQSLSEFLSCKDKELDLIRAHVDYWRPDFGFNLYTSSDSPVGGGLGGSSSLSMGLIDVFLKAQGKELSAQERVVLSGNLEAQVLKKPTGTQDYFASFLSGLNTIHYGPRGFEVETMNVDLKVIEEHLSLVYTGKPHHSGINNWSVIRDVFDGNAQTLAVLEEIKSITEDLYQSLKKQRLQNIPEIFKRELNARERLSKHFASPEITRLADVSLGKGAQAVKICGAGGGGCVALWSPPELKATVEDACRKEGFRVLHTKPVSKPFVIEVQE